MTAGDLYQLIVNRYPLPEWAVFSQVCEAGAGGRRYMDAIACNLFPSRGLEIHGFEIKVSRADWIREKRCPEKADELARYCDRWWIVVPDKTIVDLKDGELPDAWGLLAVSGKSLRQIVKAPPLETVPLTRGLMATIFRRASGDGRFSWDSAMKTAITKARYEALSEERKRNQKELESFEQFFREAGLDRSDLQDLRGRYDKEMLKDLGRAMRVALAGQSQIDDLTNRLEWIRDSARWIVQQVEERLDGHPGDLQFDPQKE
jgi:hypothetical protein